MSRRLSGTLRRLPVSGLAAFALGCGALGTGGLADLEVYVAEVQRRPGSGVEPVPEFKPVPPYFYAAAKQNSRSPFVRFDAAEPGEKGAADVPSIPPEWQQEIDENRNREELEAFELDGLRMVGSLEQEEDRWGIVKDPDGVLHSVKVGNYMGKNIGKIVNLLETRIDLREIYKDSQGRWQERTASLSLVEEES